MKIVELVKKILRIDRPGPAVEPPEEILTSIVRDALELNLKFVTGKEMGISVQIIRPEILEKLLRSNASGFMASTYSGDDVPCSQFFLPGESASMLIAAMRSAHDDLPADEGAAYALLMDWTEGAIFQVFLPRQGDDGAFLRMKREVRESDGDAVMWGLPDCLLLNMKSGSFSAYMVVPQVIWNSLCAAVTDRDFAWRLRSIAVTEFTGHETRPAEHGPASINIARPGEFILGRFFLPAALKAGETVVSSLLKKISSGGEAPAAVGFTVSLDIKVNDEIHRIWYIFEGHSLTTFNSNLTDFDGLFKSILRDTIANLKAACPGLKVAGIRYNTSPGSEPDPDAVVFHAELKVNFAPVNTRVAVQPKFINLVALNTLSPLEISLLQSTPRNRILSVLTVNSALFTRGIGSFLNSFRGGGVNIPVVLSSMPFYEFMELVSDSDLKIIAQNFILPSFSSSYMCLFRIGVAGLSDAGAAACKLYTVNSYWSRINRFLPRGLVEEAESTLHWTAADLFDGLNKKTMLDLYAASEENRLLLSARARFILKNQFFDAVQADYRKKLELLKAAGEPFASFDGVPYNVRQLAVSRVSDRDIGLVMLEGGDREQALTPLLSRTRKVKIMDDLEVLRREFRDGKITPGQMVGAIEALKESLEREKKRG